MFVPKRTVYGFPHAFGFPKAVRTLSAAPKTVIKIVTYARVRGVLLPPRYKSVYIITKLYFTFSKNLRYALKNAVAPRNRHPVVADGYACLF